MGREKQAANEVAEERGEMAGAFLVGEVDGLQFFVAVDFGKPILDGEVFVPFEDSGDALFLKGAARSRIGELLFDNFRDLRESNRLYQDFVGRPEDGGHGLLQGGIAAEQEGYGLG